MATQETQQIDSLISSRRAMMLGGGALAALALTGTSKAQTATLTDADVLNFALNLEYLEAEFYTLAASGQTLAQFGVGTGAGNTTDGNAVVTTKGKNSYTSCKVNFQSALVGAYALEVAAEERNHVTFLRKALGADAVAEPNIDLFNPFITLGGLVNVPNFDPFANDLTFLLGSYIFEDVGVSAYHGGAGAISNSVALDAAVKIHAVEAYHAGLVRTAISGIDQFRTALGPAGFLQSLTQSISTVRATLDGTSASTPDDIGLTTVNVALNGSSATYPASTVVNADANAVGWARTPAQVLNIVYATPGTGVSKGGFYPAGLNGTIKTT